MNKVFKRSVWTLLTVFFALFFAIMLTASAIAAQYTSWIDSFFGVSRYRLVETGNVDEVDSQYFKSDFAVKDESGNLVLNGESGVKKQTYDLDAMRKNSLQVAERVGEEGSVLMWNHDNALPLKEGDKISALGVSSQNWLFHGTGSGEVSFEQPSFTDALTSRRLEVNPQIAKTMKLASIGYGRSWQQYNGEDYRKTCINYNVGEVPWNVLNSTVYGSMESGITEYGDAVIYPVSRSGGEGSDTNMFEKTNTSDGKYLQFTTDELSFIEKLIELKKDGKIKKIVLLLNTATFMPLGDIAEYRDDIDACLWVGVGGAASLEYVSDLLVGNANPSGHFTDTWIYDAMSAPANENFGDFTFTEHPDLGKLDFYKNKVNKYIVYQEGIYVGYRYYETRYEDLVLKAGNADSQKGVKAGEGKWSYFGEVAYPFGYGGSYTTFAHSDFKVERRKDGDYEVSVTVKNTGERAGKDVVQIYLQKPYTEYDRANGIEKSAVELVGFAKTNELGVGASETVKIVVDDYEFKSYDSNGKGTYILEKGDYYLAAGTDAHDALNNILAAKGKTKADGMDADGNKNFVYAININKDDFETYSVSPFTNAQIKNLFDDADVNRYEGTQDQKITYLSRSDWDKTYPSAVSLKATNEKMVADLDPNGTFEEDPNAKMPSYETVSAEYGKLTLIQLKGVPYNDPLWEALLDQMTFQEQVNMLRLGARNMAGATSIAAPGYKADDGPCGMHADKVQTYGLDNNMAFPSNTLVGASYNRELAVELGEAFAMEIMAVERVQTYGTAVNIHRSAYSGRNWEYYSEDGFLTGEMGTEVNRGLSQNGIILCTKHFALNDQEVNRAGVTVWANEQSIRELYVKGFEKGVTEGVTNCIMSSFNRIGCTWAGRHKGLLTDLLRGEWGFTGFTETDSPQGPHMSGTGALIASGVVAGTDVWMGSVGANALDDYKDNATVCQALRQATHRNLSIMLGSAAMNGITSSTTTEYVVPGWEKAIIALEIVSGILAFACLAMVATSWVLWYRNNRANA